MNTQSAVALVLLGAAITVLTVALFFIVRGAGARGALKRQAYDVGRQHARQLMQVAFTRAFLALLVAFTLFGAYGVLARPAPFFPAPTPLPPTPLPTPLPATATVAPSVTPSLTATALPQPATIAATPTNPVLAFTETPTATPPSVTSTTDPVTATVNSPLVGLYLRDVPGGTQQVELLPDRLVLILLPGTATANGLEWQEVQSPAGNAGWVAADYLLYGTVRPPDETETATP